jgi:hypothetical protein
MLDHADQDNSHDGNGLRNADHASLTRRAVTDNSRALVDEVLRPIAETEARKRQRGVNKAKAFRQIVEGFLGDLVAAGQGWVYRATGHGRSTNDRVSPRNFIAVRRGLQKLGLLQEVPGVQGFGTPATRFKATSIDAAKVRARKAEGMGATEIARALRIGRASVYRALESA